MVEVLASESFDGYPLVQQVCTQLTQLSTPPRGRKESSTASTTLHVNSPLKALRNMLSDPDPCASTTNEPQLTNVDRRLSKAKRKAARERAQRGRSAPGASRERPDRFNLFNTNVSRRRPKRSSKFHVASSSFEAFFRGLDVARVCYQDAYQTAVTETRVRRMTRKACHPPPCRPPPCRPCTYLSCRPPCRPPCRPCLSCRPLCRPHLPCRLWLLSSSTLLFYQIAVPEVRGEAYQVDHVPYVREVP